MDQEIRDCRIAKEKAVERLGIPARRAILPSNKELMSSLKTRLLLFDGDGLARRCVSRLEAATSLMEFLDAFSPRLVGPLLMGVATARSPIDIHLFSDTLEEVQERLDVHGLRYELSEKQARINANGCKRVPCFRIDWQDSGCELQVFNTHGIRQAPICPIERRPMERASLSQVSRLREEMAYSLNLAS